MGFRAVVLISVTWIWCFVSQGCGGDGSLDSCADLCDMDLGVLCHRGVMKMCSRSCSGLLSGPL